MALACPSAEELERIAAGESTDVDTTRHVMTCERCARSLLSIEADNDLLAEFRSIDGPARDWAPAQGERLGPYALLDELGRGGQGIVHRAKDERTGRTVALKTLGRGALATTHMRRRFDREIEIIAGLHHPGIVTLYEAFETPDGNRAIAMECIEGTPLDVWAARRRERSPRALSPEILDVLIAVCDAVEHAHLRGVIHRDLKPSNILVDDADKPHVVDFGIAKFTQPDDDPTLTSGFVGSPAYAAPEQILGNAENVDLRADLFALGAIAYQALCGAVPFPARGKVTELASVVRDEPLPELPSRLCDPGSRAVGRDLDAVLRKALATEPDRRYRSVAELRDDLASLRDGDPVQARPDALSYILRRAMRRHRAAVVGALGVAGILVTSTTAAAALWRSAEERSRYEVSMDAVVALMNSMTPVVESTPGGALSATDRERIVRNRPQYESLVERAADNPERQSAYCHGWAALLSSGIGDHEAALAQAERAVALRSEIAGADVSLAESLQLVAIISLRLNRVDAAASVVRALERLIETPAFPKDRADVWRGQVRVLSTAVDAVAQAKAARPHLKDALDALDANDTDALKKALEKAEKELPSVEDPTPLKKQ
ncbi:MAG: serine/threonine protein kinase [Phycisphaerae bacterium]|nr:serine/threonine protein kinase [Phycisphaerae bacterium]